jgi:hypothetical protein
MKFWGDMWEPGRWNLEFGRRNRKRRFSFVGYCDLVVDVGDVTEKAIWLGWDW